MRTTVYQRRLKEEKTTPKDVVLKKYPLAVCRKVDSQSYSHRRIIGACGRTIRPARPPLGSSGTTATAWGTAAKDIWREEYRAKRAKEEQKSMFTMECALSTQTGFERPKLIEILKTFERLNAQGVSIEEFIEYLERL